MYHRLSISRVELDLDRDRDHQASIRTRSCYQDAEGDAAILRWDSPSSSSRR
jgi:hypothetical protein